jgi:hypothetical protein
MGMTDFATSVPVPVFLSLRVIPGFLRRQRVKKETKLHDICAEKFVRGQLWGGFMQCGIAADRGTPLCELLPS